MRISVVLPAPLAPSTPTISPASTARSDAVHGDEGAEAPGEGPGLDRRS